MSAGAAVSALRDMNILCLIGFHLGHKDEVQSSSWERAGNLFLLWSMCNSYLQKDQDRIISKRSDSDEEEAKKEEKSASSLSSQSSAAKKITKRAPIARSNRVKILVWR